MRYNYAREKLYLAVRGLAMGSGDARERLGNAYVYHLIHLREKDLPAKHWKELDLIKKRITKKVPPEYYEIGAVKYTLRSTQNRTAIKDIETIVKIAEELEILTL